MINKTTNTQESTKQTTAGSNAYPTPAPSSTSGSETENSNEWIEPLINLPSTVEVNGVTMEFGPFLTARRAALAYCQSAGIEPCFPKVYRKLNIARAKAMAKAFDEMVHDPLNEEVQAAYKALADETLAQWEFIKATGLQVEFAPTEQPYPNPRLAILDITEKNHFFVTATLSAFGSSALEDDGTNPLLKPSVDTFSGKPTLINDIFRVVHDYFGHCKEGLGFRAAGEENAWRGHAAMYSPLARRALAVELRGQNSWVNYGPYGEKNRKAGMDDTVFAPQKMGLLPEWASYEGMEDPTE